MASPKVCAVDGCGKPMRKRGWCDSHYQRWRRHGDPAGGGPAQGTARGAPPIERFNRKYVVDAETECWTWIAARAARSGYGMVSVHGKMVTAHRFSYQHFVGSIPDGLAIDHLCCNRACVNPNHLRPATASQNGANMRLRPTNKTGCKGVHRHQNGRFRARIMVNRKGVHLGYFGTSEEAHNAYATAAEQHFGEFARTG